MTVHHTGTEMLDCYSTRFLLAQHPGSQVVLPVFTAENRRARAAQFSHRNFAILLIDASHDSSGEGDLKARIEGRSSRRGHTVSYQLESSEHKAFHAPFLRR